MSAGPFDTHHELFGVTARANCPGSPWAALGLAQELLPLRNAPVLEVRFKALEGGTGSPVTGDIFEAERSCGMR